MNDEQLEREIQTIQEILRVRLRRYNRELKDLEKDMRELRALQRVRQAAKVPVSEETPAGEEVTP